MRGRGCGGRGTNCQAREGQCHSAAQHAVPGERETGLEALKVDAMPNGTDRERQNGSWRHRKGNMTKGKIWPYHEVWLWLVGMDLDHQEGCWVLWCG